MALALVLACVIFAFTRLLFDERAARWALFLCAFDPNLLAHGHTAGTDLGVTLFMVSCVWAWTVALKRSSWKRACVRWFISGRSLCHQIFSGLARAHPGADHFAVSGVARSVPQALRIERCWPACWR